MKYVITAVALMIAPALANATGPSFSYEGRAFDASGNPLNTNVTFKITIRPPGAGFANCVLYSETQTQNLANSNGFFTIALNGSGASPQFGGGLTSINQVFANSGTVPLSPGDCGGAVSPYTPTATDSRNLVVSISTDGTTFEDLPAVAIGSVPYAIEAQQIVGYKTNQLLRTDAGVTGTTQFTQGMMDELNALIGGTSAKYAKASTSSGTVISTYSGSPTAPVEGSLWYDSSAGGQLKVYQGGMAHNVGGGGSGITALTGDVTASGTGSVAATVANVGGQTAVDVASGALLANAATAANTSNATVKRDGIGNFAANSVTVNGLSLNNGGMITGLQGAVGGGYTLTLPASAGTSGQVLTANGGGATSWTTLTSGTGDFKADGTVPMTGNIRLNNQFLSGDGGNEGVFIDSTGNVGIGTSTPGASLQVVGDGYFSQHVNANGLWSSIYNADSYGSSSSARPYPEGSQINLVSNSNNATGAMSLQHYETYSASTAQDAYMGAVSSATGYAPMLVFGQRTGGSSYQERMRITGSGNVGIGTTAPVALLEVAGPLKAQGLTTGSYTVGAGCGVVGQLATSNGDARPIYCSTTPSVWTPLQTSPQSSTGGTLTFDFAQTTRYKAALNCGTIYLHNLKDGQTYHVFLTGTSGGTCTIGGAYSDAGSTNLTVHQAPMTATVSKTSLITAVVIGTEVIIRFDTNMN